MNERLRRPPLERTGPKRSWRGVFGPVADDQSTTERNDAQPQTSGATVEEAVSKSVEIGYRVIDEYLRQGQEVARSIRDGRASTASFVRDTTDLSTRMIQYASDFVGTWMQLLETAASTAAAPARSADTAVADPIDAPRGQAVAIELAVHASRPVEAAIELESVQVLTHLHVHSLRAVDQHAARIEDVVISWKADRRALVSITIAADQPAGCYEAVILDDARNVPVGRIRVTLPPAH